jgi:hypothetical protein
MDNTSKHHWLSISSGVLLLNCAFWVYFWACFASSSLPNDGRHCVDHCLDPYVFFGHGIGLNFNPLALPFMKQMVWVQMPSFSVATVIQNALPGQHSQWLLFSPPDQPDFRLFPGNYDGSGGKMLLGISINGYRLLATVLLSFVQWFLIARMLTWLILKLRYRHPDTRNLGQRLHLRRNARL